MQAPSPPSSPLVLSCASPSVDSVPATPTQPRRALPPYERLRRAETHCRWIHYCTNSGKWVVGFILDDSDTTDDLLWVIPFWIVPCSPGPHPYDGSLCKAWLQTCDVTRETYGEAFNCVRIHRNMTCAFYRLPFDLAELPTLRHLAAAKFRVPFHAPHYPTYVANHVASAAAATPMNNAPVVPNPPCPDRKYPKRAYESVTTSAPGGNPTPYTTPRPSAVAKKQKLPLLLPVPESPVSKSMDTA